MRSEGRATPSEDRLLTLPNLITSLRLASLPLFLWLLFGLGDRVAAAAVLAGMGATDWVDGWVARRLGQVSNLGKMLDPVADRVLLGAGIIAILVDGSAPLWVGTAALVREALVSGAVLLLAAQGAPRIDVLWVGKAGTFGLMFAFPLFLIASSSVSWHEAPEIAAWSFAIPGLLLAWIAALSYLPLARAALSAGQ
jgi:cardiolipin synthase